MEDKYYQIVEYVSVPPRYPDSAFGAPIEIYAVEEFLQPTGMYTRKRKRVAVFDFADDARRYLEDKNKNINQENTLWLEDRALLKLRALELKVQGDITDIQASVGNVPGGALKRRMAAVDNYLSASGSQVFEK